MIIAAFQRVLFSDSHPAFLPVDRDLRIRLSPEDHALLIAILGPHFPLHLAKRLDRRIVAVVRLGIRFGIVIENERRSIRFPKEMCSGVWNQMKFLILYRSA